MKFIIKAMNKRTPKCSFHLADVSTLSDAQNYAASLSRDLLQNENAILEKDVARLARNQHISLNDAREKLYNDNIQYEIYSLRDDVTHWSSIAKEFLKDKQQFVNNYCVLAK